VGHVLLLVSSCRGDMAASIRLPYESRRVRLIRVADRWAWSPLAARAAPGGCGSEPFMILGMPHMIPGIVYEWPSLHLFGSISSGVPGTHSLIRPIAFFEKEQECSS
jgi:hypothetical protein